ncbi:uncharacterized protein LOC118463448 [Anopheles albimanus]|uniref:uncharacterized protein LOC118463448 n=1 Tax=Anopheles albimanus TaxID=7167 RepID=UPI0016412F23|nr:uncharacterized protein LOC118463448 [Anopheles albimanus]
MQNEPIELLFGAICTDDEDLLSQCLETATIETILEFEKTYGESPAHLCVKLAGPNCLVLVKRLYASGLVDDVVRDSEGLTVIQHALANAEDAMAKELISMEIEGLDDATACYRMMRGGSTDVFKLYLSMCTNWSEQDTFQNIASALVKINVKNIILPEAFRIFLEWKLSDYGYRQLAGDWKGVKDPREWRSHLAVIADCWKVVSDRYDTRRYDDVDDQLLHRLEVIHNHLYLVKHKRFLRHLPLQETIFCLAIFVSIYKLSEQFHEYRMLVNKCFVIDILRMICRQLLLVERNVADAERELISLVGNINELEETSKRVLLDAVRERIPNISNPQNVVNRIASGRKKQHPISESVAEAVSDEAFDLQQLLKFSDRRIIRRLNKRYVKTKQLYSMSKMLYYCDQVNTLKTTESVIKTAAMKRIVQVLGETVKNTKNSPNLPGKVETTVGLMLTELFPAISKELREILSHSFSLKQLLIGKEHEQKPFETINSNFHMVTTAVQLLYQSVSIATRQAYYGLLYGCRTIEALRSLVSYVGDHSILDAKQKTCHVQVKQYFQEIKNLFNELVNQPVGRTVPFSLLQRQLNTKLQLVNKFEQYYQEDGNGFQLDDINKASMASNDLASVRGLLRWKLSMRWANELHASISSSWQTNHVESSTIDWMDHRLLRYNPSVMAGVLKCFSASLKSIEEFEYIHHTRELTKAIGVSESIDEEALQELNKRLKPYYDNIFFVDNKWKVLKMFCKARKLKWDEQGANRLIRSDRERLQKLFEDRRKDLQMILRKYRLTSEASLSERLHNLPTHVLSAMECCQLELCEMLVAVGYFGDSFNYVKHRIPMIQGTNYRNFLAHDSISYNLLTDSSTEKIVINAYVMANTEVQLFEKRDLPKHAEMLFPTVDNTHLWVEEQQRLKAACQNNDAKRMYKLIQKGSEVASLFCCTANCARVSPNLQQIIALVNPSKADQLVVQLLDRYFNRFTEVCNSPAYRLMKALEMCEFQEAFDLTIGRDDRVIREDLFRWPKLMAALRPTALFVHLVAAVNRFPILQKLIEYGNVESVREILPFFDRFYDKTGRGALGDATLYCVKPIVELLLPLTPEPHAAPVLLTIMLRWDDIFFKLMGKIELDLSSYTFLLVTTAQAKNYTAAVYLLELEQYQHYIPEAFEACGNMAARQGQNMILQHLLERVPQATTEQLANLLYLATLRRRWNCVRLLLDRGVPVDYITTRGVCSLYLLVKEGQHKLLKHVAQVDTNKSRGANDHPLAVSVRYGTTSAKMLQCLQRLGFDWLDNPRPMLVAISHSNPSALATIWQKLYECHHLLSEGHREHRFELALNVLHRWKAIGFVEESVAEKTPLITAVVAKDEEIVQAILDHARKARVIEGVGVLAGIAFAIASTVVSFGNGQQTVKIATHEACQDMIKKIEDCSLLEDMNWNEYTLDIGIHVTFRVLLPLGLPLELSGVVIEDNKLRASSSLIDNLTVLQNATDRFFNDCPVVHATFDLQNGATRHFWQIEEAACIYDILLPNSSIDLSVTLHFGDGSSETPLHKCFPDGRLSMVQLLMDNGANPLQADASGMAPIHLAMLNSSDFNIGRYLFDECVARDLRNSKGASVLELDDGNGGNRLLHTAVMTGRRDIIERLIRLNVDASVVNSIGVMAVHLAAGTAVHHCVKVVRMLLEYDSSMLDVLNPMGYTLLHYAATLNSLELLSELLRFEPNLTIRAEVTPLATAVLYKHVDFSRHLLNYAIEKGIKGITKIEDENIVFLSLLCNNYELTKALLEYELGHSLDEIDISELACLESILNGIPPIESSPPILQYVQETGMSEAEDFLMYLHGLRSSILEKTKSIA